jgi:hypothetical protein
VSRYQWHCLTSAQCHRYLIQQTRQYNTGIRTTRARMRIRICAVTSLAVTLTESSAVEHEGVHAPTEYSSWATAHITCALMHAGHQVWAHALEPIALHFVVQNSVRHPSMGSHAYSASANPRAIHFITRCCPLWGMGLWTQVGMLDADHLQSGSQWFAGKPSTRAHSSIESHCEPVLCPYGRRGIWCNSMLRGDG